MSYEDDYDEYIDCEQSDNGLHCDHYDEGDECCFCGSTIADD